MSFENEKDIIGDIQEDETVSWDSIIDTDQDGIVSIKDGSSSDIPTEVFSNEDAIPSVDSINIDDAIVDETPAVPQSDEIDEEELRKILGSDGASDGVEYVDDTEALDEEELKEIINNDYKAEEPKGLDAQEAVANEEEILPRKEEVKKQPAVSPLLLVLIFAVIAGLIAYAVSTFFMNNDEGNDLGQVNMPSQNEMNQNSEENMDENQESDVQNDENIPVVNEEEVEELKPEEKEEKKEVVAVVPTGRVDPFAPLQKFVYVEPPPKAADVVVKTLNNIDYDSINLPKPPKQYGELSQITDKLMSISVSGIMYDAQKPSGIIHYEGNDYFVQIGDKLNNFRVVDIGPNYIKIALGKNIYKAEVGKSFVITEDFYGNVPYQSGSRQYYSSEDEFTNREETAKKYTSDNDVQIYAK